MAYVTAAPSGAEPSPAYVTAAPSGAAPHMADATLHPRVRCDGISGRRAYLEAEGRIGAPDGPLAVRVALSVEAGVEHLARRGDAAAIAAEHHDDEVNP